MTEKNKIKAMEEMKQLLNSKAEKPQVLVELEKELEQAGKKREKPQTVAEVEKKLLDLISELRDVINEGTALGDKEWLMAIENIEVPDVVFYELTTSYRVSCLANLTGTSLADIAKALGTTEATAKEKLELGDLTDTERKKLAELMKTEEGLEIGALFSYYTAWSK